MAQFEVVRRNMINGQLRPNRFTDPRQKADIDLARPN